MDRKGTSLFIYILFGILIAVFVINFAPNRGGQGGCGTSSNTVIEVDDSKANLSAYRIAYSNFFNQMHSREKVYFALETIIRREILADAATERGLRVSGDMVDEEIKKGYFFLGGLRIPLGANIFDEHEDGTRTWNVRKFKNWVAQLDVKSTSTYRDEQTRGLQAALMYELLTSSTRVSREEALDDFLYSQNTVSYDTVTFAAAPYRAALRMSDADVDRFLASHDADVKARFQQDERLYKGLKPQLKLRQIFIAKAAEEPKKEPEQAGSGSAKKEEKKEEPKKIGMSIDEAKTKLEAARTAIAGGKQKFADAAKQLATDEGMKASGGEVGWRSVDNAQLGDKAVNDAVKTLKPGEMTPVIATDSGVYLVMAEDKREGDLDYDKVKKEIASELARDFYAKEAAKRAALSAMAEAQAGTGKNLGDMFEKEPEPDQGGGGIEKILNDPNISDEQKKQIIEQLMKKQQLPGGGAPQGSLEPGRTWTWESKDVPVKWDAPDETKGNGSGSAAPAGSASKPASGSATAAGGGSATAAGGGSAAGSGAPTGGPSTNPPVPGVATAIPPVEATKDQLPELSKVDKPKIVHFGPEPRKAPLPALSKDITPVLFDELGAGMLAKRVYEVEGNYVLVQVTNKNQAKVEDFEKDADRYISRLQIVRSYGAAEEWIEERCKALAKDKKIIPMKDLVRETDDKTGKPAPQVYQPCMYSSQWLPVMFPALRYGQQ